MHNKQQIVENECKEENPENGLFGIDAADSLESVNFATKENSLLNEHCFEEDNP